ncbi:MAG: hypothetical protein DA407_11445 [Bacteroidetes bacterium]|nr:MAG: hypothetical protein DA407_11445 [Bacteroidota bacterium]
MKKTLLGLLLTFGIAFILNAQTTFNLVQTVTLTPSDDPYAIAAGDIDKDGYDDILYASSGNGTFSWLKNDGTGNFAAPVTIGAGGHSFPNAVAIADLNNDTYNDVILSTYTSVIWYPNDQAGGFLPVETIGTINGSGPVLVRTIDSGSTLDVAVSAFDGNEVVWFSNDGSGNFGSKNIINNTIINPAAFDMADIDGDGDVDAVISNARIFGTPNDSRIEVFYNDGSGVFTADTNPVADNTKDYVWSVVFADVDNDENDDATANNAMDILVTDLNGNASWYKRTEISSGTATYSETPFTTSIVNPATIAFEDLDNDALKDVVLSSGTSGTGNDIVWFKNNDSGTFASEDILDATQSQVYTMAFGYFDEDRDDPNFDINKDIDIASAAYNNDNIKIFDNQKVVLSIDDSSLTKFSIYPNPTKNTLNFKVPFTENFKVSVYDVLGKNVLDASLEANKSLDVSKLNAGIYILKFNDYNTSFKFVKQ